MEADPVTKTLLVVDDSATMRKVFELTLLGEDVTLVTHDGSESLLARAREVRPSAAIVDVNLGATNGYDVCRALKSDAVLGRMPVLLLFSEQNPLDEAKARECGADGSISKPFETQVLIDRVKQLLSASQSQVAAVQAPSPKTTVAIGAPVAPPAAPIAAPTAPVSPAYATKPVTSMAPASAGVPSAQPMAAATKAKATQLFAPHTSPPGPPAMTPSPSPPAPPNAPLGTVPTPPVVPPASVTPSAKPIAPPAPAVVGPKPAVVAPPAPAVVGPKPAVVAPPAPAPPPVAAQPASASASALTATPSVKLPADLEAKVSALGLTAAQVEAVSALTREVVERVVWEVVPQLAETMIREEIRRLTSA
jgi:CheY-like chemotaxis protein